MNRLRIVRRRGDRIWYGRKDWQFVMLPGVIAAGEVGREIIVRTVDGYVRCYLTGNPDLPVSIEVIGA